MTTQNLGGKRIFWVGGVAECFVSWYDKLFGFQNFEQLLITIRFKEVRSRILPMKNPALFLWSSNHKRLSFTKKFRARMEHKLLDG